MPKLINVGLYAKNGWKEANDGIVHRISDLDTAIDTAFTTLAPSVPVPAGGPVTSTLWVFVAPEYMLKKNEQHCVASNAVSAYSEADKDTLRAEFGRLSQKKTNFLLVPGSVFWKLDIAKKHVWSKKKQAKSQYDIRLPRRQRAVRVRQDERLRRALREDPGGVEEVPVRRRTRIRCIRL